MTSEYDEVLTYSPNDAINNSVEVAIIFMAIFVDIPDGSPNVREHSDSRIST